MLSIENPPSDPPCPCEISQLKSSDERASDKQEVDLLKSGLDDNKNNNPLPKFSIRDYVFSARSKDIETNWPFSQKNLQLCVKHGVRDLLPPFQTLDSVRNRSGKCTVESCLISKENISSSYGGEPSRPSDPLSDNAGCGEELALDRVNINSSGSEGDKEFPSRTASQSHSEIDSFLANKSPCSEIETDTFLQAKAEVAPPPGFHRIESTIQTPVKKCRLIVKLSGVADPSSKEDKNMVSETMASKLCPVCRTFSSSSNTTLNAHIDQCLSGESTIKWTPSSKKHNVKPRKTRLMVDIYTTAAHCTLEELDRRNGTSWAITSTLPARETDLCLAEKEQIVLPANLDDTGKEGAVYIDANGTKLRILSKFNDVSSLSEVGEDPGAQKIIKGCKRSKFLSTMKKKLHPKKHHKFPKHALQTKNIGSHKPRRSSEIRGGEERYFAMEGSCEKEHLTQHFETQEQLKLDDQETILRWSCSKRTGLTKKCNSKDEDQHSGYNVTHDSLVQTDESPLDGSSVSRSCNLKTPNSSQNQISSPQSSKKIEISSYRPQMDEYMEQPPQRKKVGFSSMGSLVGGSGKRSLVLLKQNVRQLRKDLTSMQEICSFHIDPKEKVASFPTNAGPAENPDVTISSKPSSRHHGFSSKARRFSSLRKNLLPVSQACVAESSINLKRKCSSLKKSQVHCISELDDNAVEWPSQVNQQHDLMQDHIEKPSPGKTSVFKIKRKTGTTMTNRKEEAMDLMIPRSRRLSYDHVVGENLDSSVRVRNALINTYDDAESARNDIQTHGDNIEIASRMAVGGSFMSLGRSEPPLCPTADEREMFSADEVGNVMIGQDTRMVTELDSKDGQGNYFPVVDPISIPGPPGSFLPSPGDMGSDDLHGNSSLTSSRVQSSEDHHDLVDGDLSDSPISATSTISNSGAAKSDSRSFEKLSVGPHSVQDENRSDFSGACVDLVENSGPVQMTATVGAAERINPIELRNVIFPEKEPSSLKNGQPCCCSRKEGAYQGVGLNYQESQILRRRTMASLPSLAMGKQVSNDPNKKPNSSNSRAEIFYPSLGSEEVVKSPMGHFPMNAFADSEMKFPIRGDCDSATPSASNPVLRLMGKNLMVVNKEEDISPQPRQAQSSAVHNHPNPQYCTISGVSRGNVQDEGFHPFHSQGPITFGQNQNNTASHHFDVGLSNGFGSHLNFRTPPEIMFPGNNVAGGFMERHESRGGYKFSTEQNRPDIPFMYNMEKVVTRNADTPFMYNMEKVVTRNADSSSNPIKEIMIIDDDTPESEAGRRSPVGISIPMTSEYDSRHVNPFYSCQPQRSSPYFGSPVVHNANFQMTPPPRGGANAGGVKWNCTEGGSSLLHPSSLTASSSTGHVRSTLYYSPGFS